MRNFVANVLTALGVFFLILSGFLYWQRTTPRRLSFSLSSRELIEAPKSGHSVKPARLTIPELSIDLPIYESRIYGEGKWEATTQGVSYLISTPVPGQVGNSILYGHNWKSLLGNLTQAKPGQVIEIAYSDGSLQDFKVAYTQVVNPDESKILSQTDDQRITLYTCTGFLDSKRFVVTAFPSEDRGESF